MKIHGRNDSLWGIAGGIRECQSPLEADYITHSQVFGTQRQDGRADANTVHGRRRYLTRATCVSVQRRTSVADVLPRVLVAASHAGEVSLERDARTDEG